MRRRTLHGVHGRQNHVQALRPRDRPGLKDPRHVSGEGDVRGHPRKTPTEPGRIPRPVVPDIGADPRHHKPPGIPFGCDHRGGGSLGVEGMHQVDRQCHSGSVAHRGQHLVVPEASREALGRPPIAARSRGVGRNDQGYPQGLYASLPSPISVSSRSSRCPPLPAGGTASIPGRFTRRLPRVPHRPSTSGSAPFSDGGLLTPRPPPRETGNAEPATPERPLVTRQQHPPPAVPHHTSSSAFAHALGPSAFPFQSIHPSQSAVHGSGAPARERYPPREAGCRHRSAPLG